MKLTDYTFNKIPTHTNVYEIIIDTFYGDLDGFQKVIKLIDSEQELKETLSMLEKLSDYQETNDSSIEDTNNDIEGFEEWAEDYDYPMEYDVDVYYQLNGRPKVFYYDDNGVKYSIKYN